MHKAAAKAALAVHKSIMHGVRAATFAAPGTTCQVRSTQWWTTARLRSHVWRSAPCAAAYGHVDLGDPVGHEIQGTRKDLARRPPTPAAGPRPWWAMLRPTGFAPLGATPDTAQEELSSVLQRCGTGSFEEWLKKVSPGFTLTMIVS